MVDDLDRRSLRACPIDGCEAWAIFAHADDTAAGSWRCTSGHDGRLSPPH